MKREACPQTQYQYTAIHFHFHFHIYPLLHTERAVRVQGIREIGVWLLLWY